MAERNQTAFRVAAVQMDSGADRAANLAYAAQSIEEAAAAGAAVVCFPEHMDLLAPRVAPQDLERIPGEACALLSACARKHNVWVHAGSFYEHVEGTDLPANTSVVIAPDGSVAATYRKVHLFDITLADGTPSNESAEVTAGDAVGLVTTPWGVWGLGICYDLRFPELFRCMAMAGAEVIFLPANFTDPTGQAHWEPLLRTRAIENGCYLVATDQCGDKPQFRAHGNSMIIDPWGEVLARADGATPQIIYADIDRNRVAQVRAKMPSLRHRRSDVYHAHIRGGKL